MDNFSFSGATLAQAEWTEHRLLYATGELTEDVHLSGTPTVTIRLAVNKPAANLSVWLVSLPWVEGRFPRGVSSPAAGPTPRTTAPSPRASPWCPGSSTS